MIAPCVMDIKIGAKTYGPTASAAKIAQEDAKYLGTKKPLGKNKGSFMIDIFHVPKLLDVRFRKLLE